MPAPVCCGARAVHNIENFVGAFRDKHVMQKNLNKNIQKGHQKPTKIVTPKKGNTSLSS